jgi:hypothetical protein
VLVQRAPAGQAFNGMEFPCDGGIEHVQLLHILRNQLLADFMVLWMTTLSWPAIAKQHPGHCVEWCTAAARVKLAGTLFKTSA